MFDPAGNRQFQNVVIRRIRQVGPPSEINQPQAAVARALRRVPSRGATDGWQHARPRAHSLIHPGGMTACSRWWSEATPPEPESHAAIDPGRGRSRSRHGPRRVQTLNVEVGPHCPSFNPTRSRPSSRDGSCLPLLPTRLRVGFWVDKAGLVYQIWNIQREGVRSPKAVVLDRKVLRGPARLSG